jgi:hypothetical protein
MHMAKAQLPPVPPANRPKGGGAPASKEGDMAANTAEAVKESKDRNLASQGRQGNIAVNTHHQGYQQDR